jgi:16S rRNA processing protein RimM
LHNPESTALDVVEGVFINNTHYEIASARLAKDGYLLRLKEVTDRNQAETLRGPLWVSRDELDLQDDEMLLGDLVGCQLRLEDGTEWGRVSAVIAGAQDLLVVRQDHIERYLPLVDAFVLNVDLETLTVVVAPPEDLPEWDA